MGKKSKKGKKVDLGSFLGNHAGGELGFLPTGPQERADGDDGRFDRRAGQFGELGAEREDRDAPQGELRLLHLPQQSISDTRTADSAAAETLDQPVTWTTSGESKRPRARATTTSGVRAAATPTRGAGGAQHRRPAATTGATA